MSRPASVLRELLAPGDANDIGIAQARYERSFCKEREEPGGVGVLPEGWWRCSCALGKGEASFQAEGTASTEAQRFTCGIE